MAVIVDGHNCPAGVKPLHHSLAGGAEREEGEEEEEEQAARANPNVNGFSAALSCYPIVRQLASQLDLNTLHDLSRTCRQFRANLLEYRAQLVRNSLRCAAEADDESATGASGARAGRLTSGKVGRCARDMVGECQRCAAVVCRNCTVKSPPTPALRARHRRLCRACCRAPLPLLTAPRSSADAAPSAPPSTPAPRAFTAPAFERTPCRCDAVVWLCHPCGQHLKKEDTAYVRAWSWRTRYSHYLGGVGTGAGEGNEGVQCGRGPACLAAKVVEHEIECDPETAAALGGSSPERWKGSGYRAQEIEGVGGGFKLKAKKHVRVGECVKVYEDERDTSILYLQREVEGKLRSWCSWCERVVPAAKDLAEAAGASPTSSAGSSPLR